MQLLQLLEKENARLEAALGVAAPGAGLLAVDGQEAPPTPSCPSPSAPLPSRVPIPLLPLPLPCPGHGSPGPWWVFLFSRREERSRDAPSPNPEAGFSPGPWVSSVGLFSDICLSHLHPSQLLGDPDSSGGLSLLEVWPLCVPGIHRPWARAGPAPCGLAELSPARRPRWLGNWA